jgi:hypothetical protein
MWRCACVCGFRLGFVWDGEFEISCIKKWAFLLMKVVTGVSRKRLKGYGEVFHV